MNYLLIGDIHGSRLEGILDYEKYDVLICTGDFDQTKSIRQFMEIENKMLELGKKTIAIAGNHDYALLHNQEILSSTFRRQHKTFRKLQHTLAKNSKAKNYLERLLHKRFALTEIAGMNTAIMHGGYCGNMESYPTCPKEIKHLWARLTDWTSFKQNFREMKNKGKQIMIRGHDHEPGYAFEDLETGIKIFNPKAGSAYILNSRRRHIITPGAFIDKYYATINTSGQPVLEYHQLKSKKNANRRKKP